MKHMKPLASALAVFATAALWVAASTNSESQEPGSPLWLRYPAISPSGEEIVFAYGGDLYKVAATGGDAIHLTQHEARDYLPVWSPDGKSIAFSSDRFGNFDIYLVRAVGGAATRLTFHSSNDYPSGFHPDGKSILFSSMRQDSAESIGFPSPRQAELYSVPTNGGRPSQLLTTPAENAVYSQDAGKILYHDWKGYENDWRKHHTSSVARDIWVYEVEGGTHRKLTDFDGEDRNPVWGTGGACYYLSEKSGSFNVWKKPADGETVQVTDFKFHPVRFLTISNAGTLCFSYDGEIYTLNPEEGAQPKKLEVMVRTGEKNNEQRVTSISGGVTEVAVSPNGKELAYIVRGEVFVASTEHKATKRITNTPEQERSVSFSPDGRSLLYAGERGESWNLYVTSIQREEEKYFYISTVLEEKPLLESAKETFQPQFSPDGKEVAFLEERTTLRIINVDTKRIRTILPGDQNYSYTDGDQFYQWSPDGQWLASGILGNGRWAEDVALVPAGDGDLVNITRSAYFDTAPQFVLGGKVLLWVSNRHGMRSHGSWGSQQDIYGVFLTQDAFDRFQLSKEEYALLKEEKEKPEKKDEIEEDAKEREGDKEDEEEENGKSEHGEDSAGEPKAVEIDWVGLQDRKVRLTRHSSDLAGAVMSPDGEKLYYLSKFEDGYDLWVNELFENVPKLLTKFSSTGSGRGAPPTDLKIDPKGKFLVVMSGGNLFKIDTGKPTAKTPVSIGSEMTIRPADERAYIFEHSWRQLKKKFYVEDLHGVDWDFYKREYAKFLPHINNNWDFAEMLSEMLGELKRFAYRIRAPAKISQWRLHCVSRHFRGSRSRWTRAAHPGDHRQEPPDESEVQGQDRDHRGEDRWSGDRGRHELLSPLEPKSRQTRSALTQGSRIR